MSFRISNETLIGGIARINVGPDRVPFEVHKKVLCDQSLFFDRKFKEIENSNNTTAEIDIPQYHPNTFVEVINWMYKGELDLAPESSNYNSLFALCQMADYLQMADLQHDSLHRLVHSFAGKCVRSFLAQAEEQGLIYDPEATSSDSE